MTDRLCATHSFTTDELVSALALLIPRDEATKLAEPCVVGDARLEWRVSPDGIRHALVPSESLTEDTLILLSLVSEDLARRVAAYRAEGGLDEDRTSEAQWLARREGLRRFLASGGKVIIDDGQ